MPLLRKIQKSKWYLNNHELQADVFGDIRTKGNELSLYFLDDQKIDLKKIATALILTCDYISNFDYAIINESDLEKIGVTYVSSKKNGQTPDPDVNLLHYDLIGLTAQKLFDFANIVLQSEKGRISEKEMREQVRLTAQERRIEKDKIRLTSESQELRSSLSL